MSFKANTDSLMFAAVSTVESAVADIIFVHGIDGDAHLTWLNEDSTEADGGYWPKWLGKDLKECSIYTLGHPISGWNSMAKGKITNRELSKAVLEYLCSNGIGQRPIFFVCHSLGGIIVKHLIRTAHESQQNSWSKLSEKINLIAFIATPHQGSRTASTITNIAKIFASSNLNELTEKNLHLLELNESFRGAANAGTFDTIAYYETAEIPPMGLIVDKASSDPGVVNCDPNPVMANHIEIAKPMDRSAPLYTSLMGRMRVKLDEITPNGSSNDDLEIDEPDKGDEKGLNTNPTPPAGRDTSIGYGESDLTSSFTNNFIQTLCSENIPATLIEEDRIIGRPIYVEVLDELIRPNYMVQVQGSPKSGKSTAIRAFVNALSSKKGEKEISLFYVELESKKPIRAFVNSFGHINRTSTEFLSDGLDGVEDEAVNYETDIERIFSYSLPLLAKNRILVIIIEKYDQVLSDENSISELKFLFNKDIFRHAFTIIESSAAQPPSGSAMVGPSIEVGPLNSSETEHTLIIREIPENISSRVVEYLEDDSGLRIAGYLTAAAALHPKAIWPLRGVPTAGQIVDDIYNVAANTVSSLLSHMFADRPGDVERITRSLQAFAIIGELPFAENLFRIANVEIPDRQKFELYGLFVDRQSDRFRPFFSDAMRANARSAFSQHKRVGDDLTLTIAKLLDAAKEIGLAHSVISDAIESTILWLGRFAPNSQALRMKLSGEILIVSARDSASPILKEDRKELASSLNAVGGSGELEATIALLVLLSKSSSMPSGWTGKKLDGLARKTAKLLPPKKPLARNFLIALDVSLVAVSRIRGDFSLAAEIYGSVRSTLLDYRELKGNTDLPWSRAWIDFSLNHSEAAARTNQYEVATKLLDEVEEYTQHLRRTRRIPSKGDWGWILSAKIGSTRLLSVQTQEKRLKLLKSNVDHALEGLKSDPTDFDSLRFAVRSESQLVRELSTDMEKAGDVDAFLLELVDCLGSTDDWSTNMRAMVASLMRLEARAANTDEHKMKRANKALELIRINRTSMQLDISEENQKATLVEARLLLLLGRRHEAKQICQKVVDLLPSAPAWHLLLRVANDETDSGVQVDYFNDSFLPSPEFVGLVEKFEKWAKGQKSQSVQSVRLWCLRQKWRTTGSIERTVRTQMDSENRNYDRLKPDIKEQKLTIIYNKRVSAINNILKYAPNLNTAVVAKAENEAQFQRNLALIHKREFSHNRVFEIFEKALLLDRNELIHLSFARYKRYIWDLPSAITEYEAVLLTSNDLELLRTARLEMARCIYLVATIFSNEELNNSGLELKEVLLDRAKNLAQELVKHSEVALQAAILKDQISIEMNETLDWNSLDRLFTSMFGDIGGFPNVFIENIAELIEESVEVPSGIVDAVQQELVDVNVIRELGKCYLRAAEVRITEDSTESARRAFAIFNACSLLERSWAGNENVITSYYRARSIMAAVALTEVVDPFPEADTEGKSDLLSLAIARLQSVFDRTLGKFKLEISLSLQKARELQNSFK